MENWKFYIETYGCKVNQYESQQLREAWSRLGGVEIATPENADFICINSCAVTGRAERDSRNAIYRARRRNPAAKIILCGCAAQFFPQFRPRKNAIYACPDYCLPQSQKKLLLAGPFSDFSAIKENAISPQFIGNYGRARAVVKVQDGCSQNCAYCIVPKTRGKPRSRSAKDILAECRALLAAGFCELVISGINLRQYGVDQPGGGDFWTLLAFLDRELAEYTGKARLRLSSIDPAELNEHGLATLQNSTLICPHMHLSLQHASPQVLKKMGRGHYRPGNILEATQELRKHWQIMGLGADILVGFPGETETDIEILLDFIGRAGLSYAHVFPYSRRPGTAAADFADQLTLGIKQERAARVRQEIDTLKKKFLCRQAELPRMSVVLDNPENHGSGVLRGINEYYAPCHIRPDTVPENTRGLIDAVASGIVANSLEVEPRM